MAITPVSNRYKGFIFDGENSRSYGVYVTDVEVFGAPKRDVEMLAIPGRNGAYALDKGRFENIEVKYICAIGADTESDFNDAMSDFRCMLASRKGYKRLTDEINTGEYRMAVFSDGVDVASLNKKTGTFDVVFDCKPQRFLTVGETGTAYSSGDTITNPTLFESHPLLECDGYGTVAVNGEEMEITLDPLGHVILWNGNTWIGGDYNITLDTSKYRTGDHIVIKGFGSGEPTTEISIPVYPKAVEKPITSISISETPPTYSGYTTYTTGIGATGYRVRVVPPQNGFTAGTAGNKTQSVTITGTYDDNGVSTSFTVTYQLKYAYNGSTTIAVTQTATTSTPDIGHGGQVKVGEIYVDSTKTALGHNIYIDLDIGEAYYIDGGSVISLNNSVSIPAELPVLNPGANTITYDNTFNTVKVTPRWWEV